MNTIADIWHFCGIIIFLLNHWTRKTLKRERLKIQVFVVNEYSFSWPLVLEHCVCVFRQPKTWKQKVSNNCYRRLGSVVNVVKLFFVGNKDFPKSSMQLKSSLLWCLNMHKIAIMACLLFQPRGDLHFLQKSFITFKNNSSKIRDEESIQWNEFWLYPD